MYSSFYGSDAVKASVETVQNAAGKHGIDGHSAALRWTAYHSALDGNFGDAVIFAVSRLEQLDKTIDALQAGPLPDELAVAMGEVYGTLDGTGPSYHL
jgi:aryl-alcohol dehydrogenase-like predicted oxidoreductase